MNYGYLRSKCHVDRPVGGQETPNECCRAVPWREAARRAFPGPPLARSIMGKVRFGIFIFWFDFVNECRGLRWQTLVGIMEFEIWDLTNTIVG